MFRLLASRLQLLQLLFHEALVLPNEVVKPVRPCLNELQFFLKRRRKYGAADLR